MAADTNTADQCKLCQREEHLQVSHIVPRFVRRTLRGTGAVEDPRYYTGEGGNFRKVEQDLPKRAWLCGDCEQNLSVSEKAFAEGVYHGLWHQRGQGKPVDEDGIRRFLVSMAWRTWHWFDEHKEPTFGRASNGGRLREAEEVWRNYLLGKRTDVADFKQHILVQQPSGMTYPSQHRPGLRSYMTRGFNLDLLRHAGSDDAIVMVHTKIPRLSMFGVVEPKKCGYWSGTLVEPGSGETWSHQKASVPPRLFEYMATQGKKMLDVLDTVPEAVRERTSQKMDRLIEREGDDYLEREAVRAMVADGLMELPEESIVSDAVDWASNHPEETVRRTGDVIGYLSEAEMKSLHRETNRISIRCKVLGREEELSILANGKEGVVKQGKAILVGVEAYKTRERAEQRSRLPIIFGLDAEDVAIAIGAEVVEMPKGHSERGIRYRPI